MRDETGPNCPEPEISDQDVREAMQEIPGYLDITYGDFRELYRIALRHARSRIRHTLRVRDVMSSPPVTVRPDTSLAEVAEYMARQGIGGVPVIDAGGAAVGLITVADFLLRMGGAHQSTFMGVIAQCLRGGACLARPIRAATAADIMTTPPVTIREDATVFEAAERLEDSGVSRLPVLSEDDRVVGILTRADLVRAHLG